MGWIRIDDAFLDHPKFLEAGPLAGFLNIAAIAWSNRNLTDGFIPRRQVPRLVNFDGFAHHLWSGDASGGGEDADAMGLARELVQLGLWEEVPGGYRIHDYHDWQQTREQILAARDDARERQAKRRSHAKSQRDTAVTSAEVPAKFGACHGPEEVRSKKEEVKTPPTPPGGNRERDHLDYRARVLEWAAQAGVTGDRDSVLRAYGQVPRPSRTPERFRGFCRQYFPALSVDPESLHLTVVQEDAA
jgi:hypothetical protein